uniref:Ig-like domain-containing protein n=1 Tax=Varanus komodoensis TaxID=61221 RepID=A0A8D2L787_VARKO
MAWALLFWTLLSFCAGKAGKTTSQWPSGQQKHWQPAHILGDEGLSTQQVLTQPPSQSMSLGQTVKLSCTGSGGGSWNYFSWYRHLPGQGPKFLLYGSSKGEGIPDRFSGSTSGTTNYLNIANAQAEDEADYYCLSWERKSNTIHSDIFRWGGQSKIFVLPP